MIRPIGNRLLVKPLHQDALMRSMITAMRSDDREYVQGLVKQLDTAPTITLVQTTPPVAGRVVSIGKPFCTDCRASYEGQIAVDDVVVYHKSAGMEVEIDRVPHLMMRPDDVLLIWRPDAKEPHGQSA